MLTRRRFLGAISYPVGAAATVAALSPRALPRLLPVLADAAKHAGAPEDVAADESFWFEVQQAFTPDRSVINLNNGGVSPSPAVVQAAMRRHLDLANTTSAWALWQIQEPQREGVRTGLARLLGCDREEIAITRNASEGLEICQLGFDLKPGDEVLATNQDYPRMLTTFRQMERRQGIVLKTFSIPVPAEDPAKIVSLYQERITPKTRLILVCQVINLTGQILPAREIVRLGRARGIPVVVDGAHAFAHVAFTRDDLECDYYATSLHKWLFAPHGTGMLYVRKDKIPSLWPTMAAPREMDADIRKYEEIGTHPAANALAIAEALTFHEGIGGRRKEARMRHLRDHWAKRLRRQERVRLHTSLDPAFSCGIATFEIEGVDTGALGQHLWDKHRILTTPIKHDDVEGLRISPSLYTTKDELDRFCDVVEGVIKSGLPKS